MDVWRVQFSVPVSLWLSSEKDLTLAQRSRSWSWTCLFFVMWWMTGNTHIFLCSFYYSVTQASLTGFIYSYRWIWGFLKLPKSERVWVFWEAVLNCLILTGGFVVSPAIRALYPTDGDSLDLSGYLQAIRTKHKMTDYLMEELCSSFQVRDLENLRQGTFNLL